MADNYSSEIPGGATHWSSADDDEPRHEAFWMPNGDGTYDCWALTKHTKPRWQHISVGLPSYAAEIISGWTSDELPPVGTICTMTGYKGDPDTADYEKYESHVSKDVTIIAHRDIGDGLTAAVYEIDMGFGLFEYYAMCAGCFAPKKSAEQIEKEARSKACDAMYGIMTSPPVRDGNRSDMAEALYDAGYRKFEITDDSDLA